MKTIKDGDWQTPVNKDYIIECCDCGLRHRMDFRLHYGDIQFRAVRLPKASSKPKSARSPSVR